VSARALAWALIACLSLASEAATLPEIAVDVHDKASLQRGARLFVNYCLSCHSATYMRFSRLARDLDIPEAVVEKDLMFVGDKIGDTMQVAMNPREAESWFGVTPPDLSVLARARGVDWVYAFLTSFYRDPSRPGGVNNLMLRNTAMPHVLWDLQGWQEPVIEHRPDDSGKPVSMVTGLRLATPGSQSDDEFRASVRDLVGFLAYLSEPAKSERQRVGIGVLLFLAVFLAITYLLKREYWRDVHR
jgi:ubiquinol-cytochrome c reductase cytochrome c1 subunit